MKASDETTHSKPQEPDFMRLFLRHESALRAYARSILPDWNSVDDALQDASVVMWQKLTQLENEDGFLPWAKVIVRYRCLHVIEDIRRQRPLLSGEVLQMLAEEVDPITPSEFAELRITLDLCMAEFSESHRELLLAPYGSVGYVKQLAIQSGKSANSLYKMLGRLRGKLADCIESKTRIAGA